MKERNGIKETIETARNYGKILCLLLTMVISVMAIGVTETNAATYYVSPNGSDSNDGSIDNPWATIRYALSNSGPGDTVMLRAGTYDEGDLWISGNSGGGAPGQYWTLQAYPGEEAIYTNRIGIAANYVRIKGLHFTAPRGKPYVADGDGYGRYVEILDNLFTGAYTNYSGVIDVVEGPTLVEGNILDLTPSGTQTHGIYIMAGKAGTDIQGDFTNDGTIVRNNVIINASYWGIHVFDERKKSTDLNRVIKNIIIENNLIVDPGARGGILLDNGTDTKIQNAIVRNNVMINPSITGISIVHQTDNVKAYNNTIYNSTGSAIWIDNASNVDIKNNIISGNIGRYHIDNSRGSFNLTVENNLYWPGPPKLYNTSDSNPITGDPLFVNPGADDFHLQSGSAAIDTGVYLAEVAVDKDGNPRPMDGDSSGTAEYDIGAYEYRGVSCSYSVSPPTIKPFGSSGGTGSAGVSSCTPTVPVPIGQRGFPYDPTTTPEASTNPAEAMPIGVGDVATGGDILNIQISLGQFSGPVDIYGAYMLSTDPDNIYILNPDLSFQVFSVEEIVQALSDGAFPVGVEPWMEKTVGPIDETLFNMPTTGLPTGTYYLYLLITPAGSLDNYYLWRTYFEVIGD